VAGGFPEPLIDLSVIKAALRRRRRLWLATGAAGLLLGAALSFLVPAKYDAVTDLYLVQPTGSDPAGAIVNDMSLLQTRAVAQRAIDALHLKVSAGSFVTTYTGTALSDVIVSVKLTASSSRDAVAYDNAVASAFLGLRAYELTYQTNLLASYVDTQVAALQGDINQLTSSINALSVGPATTQSSNQLTQLVSERSNDSGQIGTLQGGIQQDLVNERTVIEGSKVLDTAELLKTSAKKAAVEDALSGVIGGLAAGMAVIILGAIISDRPRRRADVAAVLGSPVALSVGRYRAPRWQRRWRAHRRVTKPSAEMRLIERNLRAAMGDVRGTSLAIVNVEAPYLAALSTAVLARSFASEGKRVLVVDTAEGRPLASLFGVRGKQRRGAPSKVEIGGQSMTMVSLPDDLNWDPSAELLGAADVVLVVGSVDPAVGASYLASWARSSVVMLTAGKASATRVTACGQMLRDAGVPVRSAILIGADRDDETVGSVSSDLLLPQRSSRARTAEEDLAETAARS
jgi:capsular polysaccharide biosynthesis protein